MEKPSNADQTDEMCITVAQLVDSFFAHKEVLVATGELSPATVAWYRPPLSKLMAKVAGLQAKDVRQFHLVGIKCTNAFVRSVKALFDFAVDQEFLTKSPLSKMKTPPCGERTRVLQRPELVKLYRAAPRAFRLFLFVQFHTLARPGEIRTLRWSDVRLDDRLIVLHKFKAKGKRKDGKKIRTIPLDAMTVRMLSNWYRRRSPSPTDYVFVSPKHGHMWTSNALRCRMRRYRGRAGLEPEDPNGERVVCYTLRHTAATNATKAGLRDRELADIMGHTKTQTTARYQHLDGSDLVAAMDRFHANAIARKK
jgi:integrase